MTAVRMMERSLTMQVEDADLYVKVLSHVTEDAGHERRTIVFLHEALGSVGQWKSFPLELCRASGCDGVVYDRKGHGRSSAAREPRNLDFYNSEAETYLHGLLQQLNIRRPVLFGHSDGATIALKYASSCRENTAAVISEAAHVIIEDVTLEGIRAARQLYQTTDLREKLSRYHGEKTDAVFSAWADTWLSPELADWNMLADLQHITSPVLIVQGENDQYGSRAQVDSIARHVSGKSGILWINECGHVPHLEARARVIEESCALISALR